MMVEKRFRVSSIVMGKLNFLRGRIFYSISETRLLISQKTRQNYNKKKLNLINILEMLGTPYRSLHLDLVVLIKLRFV